jgi:hypothetical protein
MATQFANVLATVESMYARYTTATKTIIDHHCNGHRIGH